MKSTTTLCTHPSNTEKEDPNIIDVYKSGLGISLKVVVMDREYGGKEKIYMRQDQNDLQDCQHRYTSPKNCVTLDRCASANPDFEEEEGHCSEGRDECVQVEAGDKQLWLPRA